MAKLTYKERAKMPKKSFAVPSKLDKGIGGYPINDKAHARNALARVSQFGSSLEKAKVRAEVHKKFPAIGKKTMKAKGKKFAAGAFERARRNHFGLNKMA